MANRTRALYDRVFQQVTENIPNDCEIRYITTDFELAAIQSIGSIERFSNSTVKACYFHLQQSIWKRIQDIGAATLYTSNTEFAIDCRMLAALAFVPVEKVCAEFENLASRVQQNLEFFDQLIQYFQSNYIGNTVGGRQIGARFPPTMWNLFTATGDGVGRTNNLVEGYHNHLNRLVGSSHPTIGKLVPTLKSDIEYSLVKVDQQFAGIAPEPWRTKYTNLNDRISRIVATYNNDSLNFEYLRQIASIFI